MTRCVLVEQRPLGRVDHEDERAAVARARPAATRRGARPRPAKRPGHQPAHVAEARQPLLVRHAQVAEAHRVRFEHAAGLRPYARVLRRIHVHDHVVRQTDGLAARNRHELRGRHALLRHHADRLVRAHDRRARVPRDPLGTPEVVEVGVPHEDPVGAVDVVGSQPRAGRARRAVDIGIQEHDEIIDRQAEGRAAIPIERCRHPASIAHVRGSVPMQHERPIRPVRTQLRGALRGDGAGPCVRRDRRNPSGLLHRDGRGRLERPARRRRSSSAPSSTRARSPRTT